MTGLLYLAALAVSIAGIALVDRQWRLAFWHDARRAGLTVAIGVLGFLVWDAAGLVLGIFARGESPWMTGLQIAPDLPIEEVVFLTLLSYVALVVWRLLDRAHAARGRRGSS